MRTIILISLTLAACTHNTPVMTSNAMPNRVCAMTAFSVPAAKCTDAGHNELHGDVARIELDGGVKMCWETFTKDGFDCTTMTLSKAEAAANAVQQERERAKQEAEAKAKAETPKPAPAATLPASEKPPVTGATPPTKAPTSKAAK